jgi:hypothetical protein
MSSPVRRLINLRARLERAGAVPGDSVYDATGRALDATHALLVELHYASCQSGVARMTPATTRTGMDMGSELHGRRHDESK